MEKLLLFHLSDTDSKKIARIAAQLKFCFETVEASDYSQPLGVLADSRRRTERCAGAPRLSEHPPADVSAKPIPKDSLLLFCGFSDKRMDRLLFALRSESVSVDFKAVLTPTNRTWDVRRLLLEMHREKAALPHG